MDGVAWLIFADEVGEGAGSANFGAVDGSNDVFVFETGFIGRTSFNNRSLAGWAIKIGATSNWEIV